MSNSRMQGYTQIAGKENFACQICGEIIPEGEPIYDVLFYSEDNVGQTWEGEKEMCDDCLKIRL